jgi:hypothetical protein
MPNVYVFRFAEEAQLACIWNQQTTPLLRYQSTRPNISVSAPVKWVMGLLPGSKTAEALPGPPTLSYSAEFKALSYTSAVHLGVYDLF